MEIEYIGEHLLPGKAGNFFVALSFVAALFASISYFFAVKKDSLDASWNRLGRIGFSLHGFAVLGIIGTLFYMLLNHMFEYHYIWQHSNTEMPMRYILSSFWEGQEGSFLLWTFWNAVLGVAIIITAKKPQGQWSWEPSVMAVICLVQVALASMLLGITPLDIKIGSNPFILLREHADFANLPFLQNPEYLAKLDGRGLNPLLQNYWMTIHPPTLFLGFASTMIPFAFGIAGLWQKKYTEWLKPALPWTFFGVMILGTGILMGGAWAYEALSFGGFWAWDPVENASLVPWITLVGAAHVMLINKNKGGSLMITYILTFLTFLLVLYSTYLTRSGVLQETSVHAFTAEGMELQLIIFMGLFVAIALGLLIFHARFFPKSKTEESIWSREFWMFVAAIVLLCSAFQISFVTSIPVVNKLLGTNLAPPIDAIAEYNSWQVPFAIIISILMAVAQYFKYKTTEPKKFWKEVGISFGISLVIAGLFAWGVGMSHALYIALLWATVFAVVANFAYFATILKGKTKLAGASIAHVGFALLLMGALLSTALSEVISQNTSTVDLEKMSKDFPNQENIMLRQNDTLKMGDYFVMFKDVKKEGVNIYYTVDYFKKLANGTMELAFTLSPLVQTNPRMGNVAEPDTKHFLHKDIYTHVTYADLSDRTPEEQEQYNEARDVSMHIGDTIWANNCYIILQGVNQDIDKPALKLEETDMAFGMRMKAVDHYGKEHFAEPVFAIRDVYAIPIPGEFKELGVKINVEKLVPEEGRFDLKIAEKNKNFSDFIIMKAIIFPFINILWAGCIIMVIGTVIAIRRRLKTT